jgi:hypothetical protein
MRAFTPLTVFEGVVVRVRLDDGKPAAPDLDWYIGSVVKFSDDQLAVLLDHVSGDPTGKVLGLNGGMLLGGVLPLHYDPYTQRWRCVLTGRALAVEILEQEVLSP